MGKKFKVIYDREGCIGAFACSAANPEYWKWADDGKADLAHATFNKETQKWELIIDEKDLDAHKAAAEVCPVQVITFEEIDENQ